MDIRNGFLWILFLLLILHEFGQNTPVQEPKKEELHCSGINPNEFHLHQEDYVEYYYLNSRHQYFVSGWSQVDSFNYSQQFLPCEENHIFPKG